MHKIVSIDHEINVVSFIVAHESLFDKIRKLPR